MAFIPLTDEEKRILQNGGAGETEPPEKSAGGLFGGINVSSIPEVASARDRLADLRREGIDAEADISAVMDPGLLNRGGAFTRMPAEEAPFQGTERLNLAPEGGTVVELSPEEQATVAKEAPMAESTRFLAERFREAYSFGDPDAYAEDVKRASATGIPFHLVYNDNEMRQAADWQRSLESNLDGLSKLPPALVNWLRIPGRMELARDDIGTLAQLGELLRVEEYRKNTWNITQGYRGGTASMEMGDIGTKAIFGQATEADLKRMEELRESLALNDRTKGTTGDKLVSGLGYTVGLRQEQFRTMADKALLYGAYGAGLAGLFGQAGPQVALPEELITVPAGFIFGAKYGAGLGALTKGFAMEAGNAYWEFQEIRDEEGNPLPEELIRVGAILYGIGSSGLEALQAGKLAKVVPGMGRLLTKEGISTLLKTPTFRDAVMKFFKEYSGDLTFEVLTEGAQKGWQIVVGEFLKNEQNVRELGDALGVNSDDMYGWMQQAGGIVPDPEKLGFTGERGTFEPTTFAAAMDDVWKETSEAAYSFALGLVPGAGINFLSNTLAVSRAKDMQARFNTIAGLTQESRLAKRFPPAWREAIQTMVKNGPIAEVGIDANVFYDTLNQEGLNPTEVARQLGVKAEDLEEARKNKTDIWVETGAYAEHVAGTELHDRLHQDIRVGGPEELTLREATAREKELRGQFNDAVEEASRALEASGADRAQLEEIQANVREQLQSLGAKWLKPNVVEGYATLWAHMAQQAAKRWGITPREWAERISLKIVDGEDGTKRLTASYDQQAGRFSATMDRDLLERAEQMWASGQDADAIWQATGWEMGTDGKWRYEISDAEATVSANWVQGEKTLGESMVDVPNLKLESILHHPKLFAAYPLLKRTRIEYQKSLDAIASYEPDTRRITFGPEFLKLDTEEAIKTLLHEVQHGIQVTESFAQGGSTEMIGERARLIREEMAAARQDPAYQAARREYNDLLQRVRKGEISMEEADAYWANVENTVESAATEKRLRDELNRLGLLQKGDNARTRFDAYRRLYGEAEARATELRSTWTDEQLAAEPFSATLKRMLVAEGLATEDQSLAEATLVLNPGEEYEIEIPFRAPATFEQNAGVTAYGSYEANPTLKRELTRAKIMFAEGKRSAEEIFRLTGWFQGLDGKWRFVIDDSKATFRNEIKGENGDILDTIRYRTDHGQEVVLEDILDHPDLYDAYSELRYMTIEVDDNETRTSILANTITLGGKRYKHLKGVEAMNADLLDTLLHEIQHHIQHRERFTRGGNMKMVADRIRTLIETHKNGTKNERDAAEAELKRFGMGKFEGEFVADFDSPAGRERLFDGYRRIYGEAEARATSRRATYSKEQLEAETPLQTLEIMLREEGLLTGDQTLDDVLLFPDIEQLNTDKAWSITERDVLFDVDVVDAIAGSILDHEQGEANPDNILLPPDGQTLFQVQNLEEYGGTWEPQIRKWMEKNGYAKDEIEKHLGAIRGQMAIFSALGPVQLELLPQGANLNRGKAKGPIRKNDDPIYKISFDASAMCPKRLSAAATAFEVQKRIGRALTASERMALVALYKAAGKAAPCIYCYVEAPRGKGSEFVKTGLDVVQGLKDPGKKWSKATKELALEARKEYADLGLQEGDIDVNVILDQEYASTDEAAQKLIQAPMVYKFLKSQMLSAKANLPKLYEEYSGQILDIPDKVLDELNGYAGLRFFSSSDFQEGHIADLMQAFIDMSIRLAKSHSYTKVEDYVRIFGRTGQKIQTSIFAREENGEIVMDDWQGMDWETAKAFREQFPDVGTILVAASDNIVQWALEQDWIDYIIPFHYSGLEKRFYETMGWMDFTSTQTEKSIDRKKKVQKIRMFETGSEKGISNEDGTRNYLKLALERRLYPVFPAFIFRDGMDPVYSKNGKKLLANQRKAQTDRAKARWKEMVEKGEIDWSQINMSYYKLRKDYARTDTPFNAVKADFDMEAAEAAFERFMKGEAPGAKVDTEIADDLVDLIAEHGDTVGIWALAKVQQHEPLGPSSKGWPAAWDASPDTADRTFFQDSIDTDYLTAVEAGDMETAQRMVDEAAKEAGYSYHRYTKGSPSGDVPWMMFTVDKESVENAYGNNHYVASDRDAIDIEDLIPDIAEALEEYGSTEFIRDNAEAIADELNPDDIVTSAGSWDDADVVQDVWDRVLEDRGILKVKTTNGLIVMAEQDSDGNPLVKSADPVVKDDQGNIIPLSQRFDTGTPDIRYQKRGRTQQPRGSITLQREWGAQEETVLTLTPNADKSTFLHEIGHLFLWDLEQLETSGLADEKTLEDLEALRAWWSDHVSDLAIWIRKQKSFPQELRDRLTGPGWEQRIQEAIRGRGDADVVKVVQVATQEYWARGIEAYLMEGVAPNTQLERIFAQFRTWLTGIYRALQGVPDVQLSDEVRAVMDRMVASEDAIEMARLKRESDKAASAMLAEGVADREAEQYRAAAEQAAARAKTRLLKVLMGELQEDHKKKIETARADAEKRILPELLRLPHYRVYDRLRQWTHETGEWLSSAGLTEDQMDMVPEGLMTPEGGIDREVAADLLGLESEAELMALLAEARMRPLDQVLAEMVDAEVAPLESAMNNPELLQEQAEEALMGADRIRLLSLEREILQKKISKIEGTTTQDSRTMAARAAAMTEQARDMFRGRTMRDAGAAARYMAEARRAGRQAFEAALAGRLEDALEAKDREMLFSALYLESKKLQEEREKNLRYLRKFWTGRQRLKPLVGEENLAQIQRILERYGFQQELPVEGRVPLGKWLGAANAQLGADLEETGVGIPVPDWMVAEDYRDERRSWKDLTVEEFGELHKAVKAIEHFGRTQGRLVAQEKQQNLQAWKDKLQANVVKVWGKLKPGSIDPNYEGAPSVSRFLAAHDRIEFLLRRLDGFEDLGPAWQLLFQPVVTAERSEIARMRSAKAAIESIFSSYTAEERAEMRKKKYTTAQLDPQTQKPLVLSKENILAMLLNWGARQNREEVVFGYGFDRTVFNRGQGRIHYADMEQYYEAFHRGEREVEALFAQVLTEKDYQIAQAVWDHNETYWDEVSAMVLDLTGVTPERVERLSVKSPSGTIYSGGYYHLAFKPESNIKTFALSEKAAITALYEPQGMFAMTRTGHTKARHHGQRGSRLLRLDLGVEVEHLRDVVHDLYFRPVVRDLNRLINDEQVQNIILSTLGFEAFRQLKPWVHGLATAYRPMDNYGEKVFRKLMGNTSAAILGWSMSSALNQTLGWFTVIPALGLKRTVRGIMDFYLHPTTWAEKKNFAFGKSEYLRDRVNTFDRDVKAAIEQVTESPVRGKWSAVQETFFLAAGWMDMGVSLPAWLAGYDLGMNKFNGDEAKAVEYADWIVRSTQNTGAAKDLSSIQRGGPLWKSLTMFYTAFNSIYNQTREQWFRGHGREDLPRLAAYLVFQFVMPALLGDMMNRRGPDWDDDDPEDIWKWIFTSVLQYGSSQFIGLRDVVNAATSGFDYRMSPMADAGQSLARLMTGVGKVGSAALFGTEMPDLEQLGYRALDAAGTIWGIPSKQLQRTARGLVGLADDPDWSPVDLLLRKPRK